MVLVLFIFPPCKNNPLHRNSLSQNIMICFHLIEYFQTAGEFKTCISNISISLNFWESLQRNTPFVKYQQPLPYFPSNFPCMYNTWGWGKLGEKGQYPVLKWRVFEDGLITREAISLPWDDTSQSNQSCTPTKIWKDWQYAKKQKHPRRTF